MATKRTPAAPGKADKLSTTEPGCSRRRGSRRNITGWLSKGAKRNWSVEEHLGAALAWSPMLALNPPLNKASAMRDSR